MIGRLVFVFCFLWALPAMADDVRLVQQKLKDRGYAVGKVDGKFGKQTARAIQLFEEDWQLPPQGKITSDLVARLKRKHPDTKARMQKVANGDCEMWNSYPQPREEIIYETCETAGPVSGQGRVIWRWFQKGDWQSANYVGDLLKGKLNGQGVLHYPDGHRYEGEFQDDKRHGKGVYEWPRGDRYVGEWRDGKPDGDGVYFKGDQTYDGIFKKGCFSSGKRRIWVETTRKACGFK